MKNINYESTRLNIRSRAMLVSALPFVALAMANQASAQNAVNSANVAVPSGTTDPDTSNNNATDSDIIYAVIVASNDSVSNVNGASGATAVVNAFTSDSINGVAASDANAVLSVASGSSVPAGLSFDPATGNVNVAAGTPAGTYSFDYQICEKLNPTNCTTATISVGVVAAPISADADSVNGVNGASGASGVVDVLDGDMLNGAAATLSTVDISVTTPATPISGGPVPTLNPATGLVDVPAGTPAGSYTIEYQICEKLNPTNCASNMVTVDVAASAIVASNDSVSNVNGASGATAVVNAFTSDSINGVAASDANAVLSVASGSSVPAGLSFDPATGNVNVAAGTPAGTYSFDYQICEKLNPTNCTTATISVGVVAAPISADADSVNGVNGASGASGVVDVLDGDMLNGAAATLSTVDISVTTPATPISGGPVPTLNPATGLVDVPAGTPAGSYTIEYQICEKLNPTNCASNMVTVDVAASAIVASNDSVSNINGASGATAVVNAFTSDSINGVAASDANAILSVASGSSVPAGLSFDPATGNVNVAAGTPAGTYSFDYQICEKLNPTNCTTATISVGVVAAPISADADSVNGVNGASGASGVVDVLDGDMLNGAAATLSTVDISVTTPATPISGGPVPTLNPATGLVDVPAGTPAGSYTIEYQICEKLNPTNCASNMVTVDVAASAIVASNDSVSNVNGASGATAVVNAFTSDSINGVAASDANAVLSVASGSSVPAGLSFDPATGNVNVAAGTPAGTYSFDYQICEKLNPTNCTTATISVGVVAAPISADADSVNGVNGASGASGVVDVLDGDMLNGAAATLSTVDISVTTPATPISGGPVPTLNPATGLVDVPAGTPAGSYTIEYQICEKLNPTNCASNMVTVDVAASAIVASNDSVSNINGASGATAVVNAFTSDSINGVAASDANAILSVASGSSVPAGLSFDPATGNVNVAAGTPAGTYSFDYQICEKLNPTNCTTATISVGVVAAPISADADSVNGVNGASGASGVVDVLDGDMLNGAAATLSTVDISVTTPATPISGGPVPTLNPATGLVDVPAGTPAGSYTIEYQICEKLNPTNCASNMVTVDVAASAIVASNDSVSNVNGASGATAVVNAFTSDSINGVAASDANAVLSVASGSSVPAGLSFDPATGNVNVAAGTPAGTYSFDYQICEKLNPTNCTTATISVGVVAAPISADADSVNGVNGASGASGVVDVLDGDMLNGAAATLSTVDISVTTPATPISGGPVPTLNPATGLVDVPAGTPAGSYTIEYQICEKLNPTNCASNMVTVDVAASAIVASNDSVSNVNGASGATAVVNAFTSDSINGVAASDANAVLSVASGSSVPAGLSFDPATGNVNVAAGTPAGTYSFDYQICEKLNPTNCTTATISVGVVAAPISADADSVNGVNGASGASGVVDVLDGDMLNGAAATLSTVDISVTTPATPISGGPVPTLNPATGLVDVPAGTPAGSYTIEYQICEKLNPTNCASNMVTVDVAASAIVASNDSVSNINGASGATAVVNAFTSDSINGVAASDANAVLSVASGSSVPAGLSFDPATGNVNVAAGTPAGTYSFDYQICEKLNPTNCTTATISVGVVAAPISADADSVNGVNGASGASGVVDVLDGDMLNGAAATLSTVDISVTTPATPISGGPVPTLNPATGLVDVPAGTPAGSYTIEYQICEKLNPTNCASNMVTVDVAASAIVASNDSVSNVNGASGATAVVNAFTSDSINGVAASDANAVLSVASGSSVPAGLSFDPATGNVNVAAGTPAGTYSFDYQICEKLNPTNCTTATISVGVVAAPISADADSVNGVNGASGASGVVDVLDGDMLNGAAATLSTVDISVTTPATPISGGPVPTLNPATGLVDVPAGTPAGSYTIEYQICEKLNPTNCASNMVTVDVAASAIVASNDSVSNVNGASGATAVVNAFTSDSINGVAASDANAVLSVASGSSVPAGLSFDPATGNVNVAAGTPAGTYSFDYQICEKLNPTNCTTATISVGVVAAPISADADSVNGVNGASGASGVVDVLDGDMLNGAAATLSTVDISVTTPATPISGGPVPTLNPATGLVDVPAGTPAGSYTIEYQICEKLNPTNCASNMVTVDVAASAIVASNDSVSNINGASGATAVVNAFTSDSINGVAASDANAILSVASGSSVPAGLSFDPATGNVNVAAGTPAGTYSFDYQICEKLNPTNCTTATISVGVVAAPISADADSVNGVNGASGASGVVDVLDGDMLNGAAATLSTVDISVTTPATPISGGPVPTLNPATGLVDVPAGTPAGSYTIEYQICEKLNPTNCASNMVTVDVAASAIVASNDSVSNINGASGATAVVNAFTSDSINGVAASDANAILSVASGSSVPAGLSFDPATGNVNVAAGTPAGTYSFDYQICEKLNPTNCTTATISVGVVAAPISADADVAPPVRSGIGNPALMNILANDQLNGQPINPNDVILSIISGANDPNIILDVNSGQVSVGPEVPAGTYVFEYQICEKLNPTNCATSTYTIIVDPAISSVEGTVYLDRNGDRALDNGDELRAGWIVEILRNGELLESAITDANGSYRFDNLLSGGGYVIRFRNPDNNVVYGQLENVELTSNSVVIDQNLPIDPSGVVYNSVTRDPVAGAVARLTNANGIALPATCFLDPSQQSQVTGPSGEYRFDIVPGAASQCPVGEAEYVISITPPSGFTFVSTVLLPQNGAFDPSGQTGPVRISSGPDAPDDANPTYYLRFTLQQGDPDVIYNHIPIDPFLSRLPLIITKSSIKRTVNIGDLVPYEITVRNVENVQRAGVTVVDLLPPGFKYVAGSATVDGVLTPVEAANSNRQIEWRGQIIPALSSVKYNLTLTVGAGVTQGTKVNTAFGVDGPSGSAISNRGSAAVQIVPSSIFDCSEIIGKVFEDRNYNGYQDEGEPGVPYVRLATVNGQLITTDEFGRYHIACAAVPDARIGSNYVLKLDTRTLPIGWLPTQDNPRSIRLTRGKMGEVNFGVAPPKQKDEGEE
ncbi:hypothetical protein LPB140_03610 [Sphingorhabdus lutea]|uniref:DUF11 domain-containing protein n=1 Tax=Sphingorhabdus lutea TaxID=1913578 RepID=A0A1L3JAF7_9SPHN|nr:SdrD B-like domain-containing protein [Sphingorhabdus lutea]APG62053.1 hypothetical protein LPB140_03610 [Sphingorhabdus lutea]